MSRKDDILKSLNKKLGSSISDKELDSELQAPSSGKSQAEFALEDHLSQIAAAHQSVHSDHHSSAPDPNQTFG